VLILFAIQGPNAYNVNGELSKAKLSNPSANFISQTAREPVIEVTTKLLSSFFLFFLFFFLF